MSDPIKAVWDVIDNDHDFVVNLTRELVQIPSVNPKFQQEQGLNRETDVQDLLQSRLDDLGFSTERWDVFPDRPNVVGDWEGDEDNSLILCGHVDVVPVGDASAWKRDPFSGDVDDGRIWGRGAVDMKGGVACCIAAARALKKAGISLQGRLSIHTVVDEEAGGFGAMDLTKRGKLAKSAIIAEPTWGDIVPAEGGLTWARVTIFGKQAHAGWRFNSIWPQHDTPDRLEPGINAAELAAKFIYALRDFESARCRNHSHPLVPAGLATINPGVVRAGAGLGEDGEPALLTNPAIIPDIATIMLDFKFMPDEDFEEVKAEFEAFLHSFAGTDPWMRDNPPKVEWDMFGLNFPPMNTPVDHPLTRSLVNRATQVQSNAPVIKGFEAVTDAAHYAGAGVMPVIYGPSGDGFHGNDECVEIDSLVESTKVIAAAVIDMCKAR